MSGASPVQSKPVSQFVPLAHLAESPTNPRKYFDPKKLEELASSIKEVGILEPLLVLDVAVLHRHLHVPLHHLRSGPWPLRRLPIARRLAPAAVERRGNGGGAP